MYTDIARASTTFFFSINKPTPYNKASEASLAFPELSLFVSGRFLKKNQSKKKKFKRLLSTWCDAPLKKKLAIILELLLNTFKMCPNIIQCYIKNQVLFDMQQFADVWLCLHIFTLHLHNTNKCSRTPTWTPGVAALWNKHW